MLYLPNFSINLWKFFYFNNMGRFERKLGSPEYDNHAQYK
jgi:hypothetical protein